MATEPKPVKLPDPKPENAKQAVLMVRDDHSWIEAKPDVNSTDGIKRNIEALWAAINRLAAYIDGDTAADKPYPPAAFAPTPPPNQPTA